MRTMLILKTICSYSKSSKFTRSEYQFIPFEGLEILITFLLIVIRLKFKITLVKTEKFKSFKLSHDPPSITRCFFDHFFLLALNSWFILSIIFLLVICLSLNHMIMFVSMYVLCRFFHSAEYQHFQSKCVIILHLEGHNI